MKKTKTFFPLFFILLLIISMCMINNVFSQDSYGNHLWIQNIYQNSINIGSFNNETYSEGMNFTIDNYLWDEFMFITASIVNTTVIGDGGYVGSYQGIGIQIFDEDLNSIYAGGICPSPPRLFDPEPFEIITWMSEIIELDLYETINYVNVTLWHNYLATGDVEDFELTESWEFNLVAENYEEEEKEEEEIMFFDLYFLGLILCLFVCPLSIVGVIKMRNPKLLKITAISFIGLVICFFILMNINPFGG